MAKILVSILFLSIGLFTFADEASDHKREIERLKKETAKKESELKKYKEQEKKISKEISDLESKKAKALQMQNKVESDISYVEQNLLSIEEKRSAIERSIPMWQGAFKENLVNQYFKQECPFCVGGYSLEQKIFVERVLDTNAAFSAELKKQNQEAKERIHSFEERNKKLLAQSSKIKEEQTIISHSFDKKKQDLVVTKRKAEAVRKEINEMNKSAAELNNLLASFERKRKQADAKKAGATKNTTKKENTPKLDIPRNSLPWPVTGQVISKFGKEYRSDLNTWIFRDGIKIAAKLGTPVHTVAEGSVIYSGPFRSYGNVVIMDHGKGFFSIYGFLQEIKVKVGDKLVVGGTVGTAGNDTQSSSGTGRSAVYFEVRQGTTALDPQDWLK